MARRPPARIRADAPLQRRPHDHFATFDWLTPAGRAAVLRLERNRLWPGAAKQAFRLWESLVRQPDHRLWDPAYGCGEFGCCPDPADLRWVLEVTAHALPAKDARKFRKRLAAMDERW